MAEEEHLKVDLTGWSENQARDDKKKIDEDDLWVPCRICQEVFLRIRLTSRYCNTCGRAFCEGEHGNFAGSGASRLRAMP